KKFLSREVTDCPGMNPSLGRQLDPLRRPAAIHAMNTRSGEPVIALWAMAAEQFPFGQPMTKRRVLLVAMDVVHLEVRADSQRIHREHFGAALDFRKARIAGHGIRKRSTFNVQRSTFKACPEPRALTGELLVREESPAFHCAARMLAANILINASVSSRSGSNSVGGLINGTRLASRNQRRFSLSSLRQMRNLWTKSFRDSAA